MTAQKHTPGPVRLWADPSDAKVGEGHCFVTFDFEVTSHSVQYVRADIADEMLDALNLAREALGANAARDAVDAAIAKATGQ